MDDFKFKSKFGQNFLIDKNISSSIVLKSEILPNSLVIEIGCGDGRLTRVLCGNSKYVCGYEIDKEVIPRLVNNLEEFDNFTLINDDFLNRDVASDIKDFDYDNLYVIANLPYYITTPIIMKIINSNIDVFKMVIMVQKEVALRISAKPGCREYGSISVYLNYFFKISKLLDVSRNCFYPKPNVDSSVICLEKKEKIFVKDIDVLYRLIRDSFKFKRKTLKNNLAGYDFNVIDKVLEKYGYSSSVRAEELGIEVFCDIANVISI